MPIHFESLSVISETGVPGQNMDFVETKAFLLFRWIVVLILTPPFSFDLNSVPLLWSLVTSILSTLAANGFPCLLGRDPTFNGEVENGVWNILNAKPLKSTRSLSGFLLGKPKKF